MDDYRVQVGFLGHHKTTKLKRRLGGDAVLAFLQLWEFCAIPGNQRTDGNLSGMTDEDIEIEAKWAGDPGTLVATLAPVAGGGVGFLDGEPGSYQIHEWCRLQPYIAKHGARSRAAKSAANARWSEHGHGDDDADPEKPHADSCEAHAETEKPQCPVSVSVSVPRSVSVSESLSVSGERPLTDHASVEQAGFKRFGALVGSNAARIRNLVPIATWEWDAAIGTPGRSWSYACKVLEGIREETHQGKKPPHGAKPRGKGTWIDGQRADMEEFANAKKAAEQRESEQGGDRADEPVLGDPGEATRLLPPTD